MNVMTAQRLAMFSVSMMHGYIATFSTDRTGGVVS